MPDNKLYSIGDSVILKSQPVFGVQQINSYNEYINGETATRLLFKEFRHSFDGVNFSVWTELNLLNLQQIDFSVLNTFYIEYAFTRIGSDITDYIEINGIELCVSFNETCDYDIGADSIFSDIICNNINVLDICTSLFKKLYEYGIVPNYITRDELANDLVSDRDYVSFWKTVACFFALLIIQAKKLSQIENNQSWLIEFLTQRNLFFCGDENIMILEWIMNNRHSEFFKRGTNDVFKTKDVIGVGTIKGELLRTICWINKDEFIYLLFQKQNFGWNVDNCSPLHRSLSINEELNKLPAEINDLSDYDLVNSSYISIDTITLTKNSLLINSVPIGEVSGLNGGLDKSVIVWPGLAYEVSFFVVASVTLSKLTFGIKTYDRNGNLVQNESIQNVIGFGSQNYFFTEQSVSNIDNHYFVRGIIYQENESQIVGQPSTTNLNIGNNLRFKNDYEINRISLVILVDNTNGLSATDELRIWDLSIKPLRTEYDRGFIQTPNWLNIWLKNNKMQLSLIEIERIIRHYYIPYNTVLHIDSLQTPNFV